MGLDNYDAAVLIAGDSDYVPLVEEVKRRGKVVYVGFFVGPKSGLSEELKLSSDGFFTTDVLLDQVRTVETGEG